VRPLTRDNFYKGYFQVIRFVVLFCTCLLVLRADQAYYWKSVQVDDSAQLLTLFSQDVPLVSVLRDNLGKDQISYVWLLTYSRPNLGQRVLSAVPFFYWKVAAGSTKVRKSDVKPLINMTLPQRSLVPSSVRNVIQWTVLDPLSMPVRASSRAYQSNKHDHELLHIEEARSYLQAAPTTYLTEKERDTIIARLEFRKSIMGDLADPHHAHEAGANGNIGEERIRVKNWELLRQCADKTGLTFEPINLAGSKNEYAILWLPANRPAPTPGVRLNPIWKLLNIKDPGPNLKGPIPLGVYSLTYPKMPLLMIDFRDTIHLKKHELTQRAITEITSGIIGISRFTNWYYFVGADLYDFWASRRGTAMNQQERLDCYSKFRVALELDHSLDGDLRASMQKHVYSMSVNPLESSAKNEFEAARKRYDLLQSSPLLQRLEKDRRSELARFETTTSQQIRAEMFHYASIGIYTQRAKGDDFATQLGRCRQVDADLTLLEGLAEPGTPPEVAYDSARIQKTIGELASMLPEVSFRPTHVRAERAIETIQSLSADSQLKSQCLAALDSLRGTVAAGTREGSGSSEAFQ
jgi:hypothetical protein